MHKEFVYNKKCTQSILDGAKQVANAVGVTFGANGRKVMIEKRGHIPKHTKDGVSVAREIILENKFDNLSAQSLIEVSLQMLSKVGDGTTTAILLAEAFLEQLIRYDPDRETMDKFKSHLETLSSMYETASLSGKDPKNLEGVAYVSSNGDKETTSLLRKAIDHIGDDGNILVDTSSSSFSKIRLEDGIYLPFGFSLQEFANNQLKMTGEFQDCYLILYEGRIESFSYMAELCRELVAHEAMTPIIFVAPYFTHDALIGLAANTLKGTFSAAAITINGEEKYVSELMQDISIATGIPLCGKKYKRPLGKIATSVTYKDIKDTYKVSKIKMTRDSSIILPVERSSESMSSHLDWLKQQLENQQDEKEKSEILDRIGRVSQKIAIMQVGGATRQVMLEKRDRIEDAVCAILQARKKGVLPGGGLSFIMALKYLHAEPDQAAEIIKRSILKVLWRLYYGSSWEIKFENEDASITEDYRPASPIDEYVAITNLIKKNELNSLDDTINWNGINLETNKECNLFNEGILDPTSVITTTLLTAGEFALNLMKTGASIIISRKVDLSGVDYSSD